MQPKATANLLTVNQESLYRWHCRLGHPYFSSLRPLFPSLLSASDFYIFQCDTCVLSKQHGTSYPLCRNKTSHSIFSLVHSYVWGPAPFVSTIGLKILFPLLMMPLA